MSDKFNTDMTPEELVEYIRRTPKKFAVELPKKLSDWAGHHSVKQGLEQMKKTKPVFEGLFPAPFRPVNDRNEYIFRIVERHAPHVAMTPEMLVDYAIEVTDEFLKQTQKP